MEKNLNLFFADILRNTTLTEEQSYQLQEILFPPRDSKPRSAQKAAFEAQLAYERWNKQYQIEETKKPKAPVKPKVMEEGELDELLRLEYGD